VKLLCSFFEEDSGRIIKLSAIVFRHDSKYITPLCRIYI
jgi:hypothetical protein